MEILKTNGYCQIYNEYEFIVKNLKAKTLEEPRLSSYFCNERNRK